MIGMRTLALLLIALALSGCAGTVAGAVAFGEEQQQEAYDLVREVDGWREEIRNECKDIVRQEARRLREEQGADAATTYLRKHYVGLVTVSVIKASQNQEAPAVLTDPWPCGPRIWLNPETGLLEGR